MLPIIAALVLGQTAVAVDPLRDPPAPSQLREWLPYQGHLAFNGMLFGGRNTLGVDAYFGRTLGVGEFGRTGHGAGWFWGFGAHGTFGATQAEACRGSAYCVGRWIVGPSVRAGRAWAFLRKGEDRPWPDGYAYLEATGFLGRTALEAAPLVPADPFLEAGARFALAANLVGWTRFATSGLDGGFSGSGGGNELIAVLLWLTLAFTNHFELNLEMSRGVAGRQVRMGFAIGSGF